MAASTRYLVKGRNVVVVNTRGVWAAADETATVIIDKSTLLGPDGTEPTSISIEEITWTISPGIEYITLAWDHTTDDILDYFSGQGYIDYRPYGGKNDAESSGETGDLVLSTVGGGAGDAFSFLIVARLKD